MNAETDEDFVKRILIAAHQRGFVLHEEKGLADGEPGEKYTSRFTFILTDGRLISMARHLPRREAISVICRALEPYLEKFEVLTPRIKN